MPRPACSLALPSQLFDIAMITRSKSTSVSDLKLTEYMVSIPVIIVTIIQYIVYNIYLKVRAKDLLLNYFKTLSVGPAGNRTRASRTIDWHLTN